MASQQRRTDAQRALDYSKRGDDLNNLRRSRVGDPLAKLLLWTLDNRIGAGHAWELTFAELADEMEVSDQTARNKAELLRGLGLIDVEEIAGSAKYRFRIVRSNVADFIPDRPKRLRRRPGRPRKPSHLVETISTTSETISTTAKTFPPGGNALLPNAHSTPTTARRVTWEEAEARLISYGVGSIEEPIRKAIERGVGPELILSIVDHAERHPGAWGPGAVRRRILGALPGQNPSEGWLEPSDEFKRAQKAAQNAARAVSTVDRESPAVARLNAKLQGLEAAHGEELDQLDDDQVAELAREAGGFAWRQFKTSGRRGVRPLLLEALQKRLTGTRRHDVAAIATNAGGRSGFPAAGPSNLET